MLTKERFRAAVALAGMLALMSGTVAVIGLIVGAMA